MLIPKRNLFSGPGFASWGAAAGPIQGNDPIDPDNPGLGTFNDLGPASNESNIGDIVLDTLKSGFDYLESGDWGFGNIFLTVNPDGSFAIVPLPPGLDPAPSLNLSFNFDKNGDLQSMQIGVSVGWVGANARAGITLGQGFGTYEGGTLGGINYDIKNPFDGNPKDGPLPAEPPTILIP
ncbi:hypothetical protein [Mucilaginibacter mallensis]|uniref:hypothetical protein n=1 Tax=Mucilaginibacter mallensis TaxID=652787 RepID=UPI000B866173|nr:hypothetical protein [Mucilaginibacter mallensis]